MLHLPLTGSCLALISPAASHSRTRRRGTWRMRAASTGVWEPSPFASGRLSAKVTSTRTSRILGESVTSLLDAQPESLSDRWGGLRFHTRAPADPLLLLISTAVLCTVVEVFASAAGRVVRCAPRAWVRRASTRPVKQSRSASPGLPVHGCGSLMSDPFYAPSGRSGGSSWLTRASRRGPRMVVASAARVGSCGYPLASVGLLPNLLLLHAGVSSLTKRWRPEEHLLQVP